MGATKTKMEEVKISKNWCNRLIELSERAEELIDELPAEEKYAISEVYALFGYIESIKTFIK